jgi:predicted nuclease with TOPRIM domain
MDELNSTGAPRKKMDLIYFIVILVLLISNGFFAYKFYTMRKEKVYVEVELQDTNNEKASLETEFNDMLAQYDALKTDNTQISGQLEQEKTKIKEMLEEIKGLKSANYYQISQYKKELGTLREIMRSYIVQIDSLNTRNKLLVEENKQVKTDFQKVKSEKDNLQVKTDDLSQKVDVASALRAINISSLPVNEKGKEVTKAKKVIRIKVCFTLTENAIAKTGNRVVYLRIARPDKEILPNTEGGMFDYEGNQILYSAKREIDYQSKDVDMCVYWANSGDLTEGVYTIDLFSEGKQIGTATFGLK